MEHYNILGNDVFPFQCQILDGIISIYRQNYISKTDSMRLDKHPFFTSGTTDIFLGQSIKCPHTLGSAFTGKKWLGNSILIKTIDNKYVWIGRTIYSFDPLAEITEFYSPIGNNGIPYPYAIDINNNIY